MSGGVPAPTTAVGWTPTRGWVGADDMHEIVQDGHVVYAVTSDGVVVFDQHEQVLHALCRLDSEVSAVLARVDGIGARVGDIADHVEGVSTSMAVEVSAVIGRLRRIEDRRFRDQ